MSERATPSTRRGPSRTYEALSVAEVSALESKELERSLTTVRIDGSNKGLRSRSDRGAPRDSFGDVGRFETMRGFGGTEVDFAGRPPLSRF